MLSFIFFVLFIISIFAFCFVTLGNRINSIPIGVFVLITLILFLVTQISNREVVTYKDCVEVEEMLNDYF